MYFFNKYFKDQPMIFYLTESDEILIPFDYKPVIINDVNIKSNIQLYDILINLQNTSNNISYEDLKDFDYTQITKDTLVKIDLESVKSTFVFCTDVLRGRSRLNKTETQLYSHNITRNLSTNTEVKNKLINSNTKTNFVLIDSRCIKTITYLAYGHTGLFIYNVDNIKIETFLHYVNNKFFTNDNSYIITEYNKAINILFIYNFIKFFCKSLEFDYNQIKLKTIVDSVERTNISILRMEKPNFINIMYLYKYMEETSNRIRSFNKFKEIDIGNLVKIQDNIKPFPKTTQIGILIELKQMLENSKVLIL